MLKETRKRLVQMQVRKRASKKSPIDTAIQFGNLEAIKEVSAVKEMTPMDQPQNFLTSFKGSFHMTGGGNS